MTQPMTLRRFFTAVFAAGIFLAVFPAVLLSAEKFCEYDSDCGKKCGGPNVESVCGGSCPSAGVTTYYPCYCFNRKCLVSYDFRELLRTRDWTLQQCNKLDAEPRQQCLTELAKKNKDASYCEEIAQEAQKNSCYKEAAMTSLNLETCKKIKEYWQFGLCVTEIAKGKSDISLCENLTGKSKSLCIYTVAIDTKNLSLCAETSVYRYECEDIIKKVTGRP